MICLALAGVFAGAEAALFFFGDSTAHYATGRRGRRSAWLARLLEERNEALFSVLAGKYVFLSAASLILADAAWGWRPAGLPLGAFYLIAGAAIWITVLTGAELLPRAIAQRDPEKFARRVSGPALAMHRLALPLRIAIRPLFSLAEGAENGAGREALATEETLKNLLGAGLVEGLVEEDEQEMIDSVMELRDATAGEILTPRAEIVAFSIDTPQEAMLEALRRFPHTRAPIFHENLDQIEGLLLVKEALLNPQKDYRDLLRQPVFVPLNKPVSELLVEFKRNRTHMAFVLDEYGGVAGMATLYDILENIVGDIDLTPEALEREFQALPGGRYAMDGTFELDDLAEKLGISFPAGVARTIGGFVMNTLGRLPARGMAVRHAGFEFRALRMAGRRIARIEACDLRKGKGRAESPGLSPPREPDGGDR